MTRIISTQQYTDRTIEYIIYCTFYSCKPTARLIPVLNTSNIPNPPPRVSQENYRSHYRVMQIPKYIYLRKIQTHRPSRDKKKKIPGNEKKTAAVADSTLSAYHRPPPRAARDSVYIPPSFVSLLSPSLSSPRRSAISRTLRHHRSGRRTGISVYCCTRGHAILAAVFRPPRFSFVRLPRISARDTRVYPS